MVVDSVPSIVGEVHSLFRSQLDRFLKDIPTEAGARVDDVFGQVRSPPAVSNATVSGLLFPARRVADNSQEINIVDRFLGKRVDRQGTATNVHKETLGESNECYC